MLTDKPELNRCAIEREQIKVTLEIGEATVDKVLEAIEDCLKGVGFNLGGNLQVEEKDADR